MAASVTHAKTSGKADGGDATLVQPSDWNAGHVISGLNLVYVATATVTGSAATTLTVSSLDLATDQCYIIQVSLANATGTASGLSLYYNADTTTSNYARQQIIGNNTGVSGSRGTDALLFPAMPISSITTGLAFIFADQDGRARARSWGGSGDNLSILIQDFHTRWSSTANVTSITLSAAVASSLAVGSFLKVFKLTS